MSSTIWSNPSGEDKRRYGDVGLTLDASPSGVSDMATECRLTEREELLLETSHRIQCSLQHAPIADVRRIQIHREGDRMVLTGELSCFYHKQIALQLVGIAFTVIPIEDRIRVRSALAVI